MAQLTITKLKPGIGAEISGIDLSQPIDAETREQLSRALAEHLALVFHNQTLTPDQYLHAAGAFGPVMRQHYSQHHMDGYWNIGMVYHRNGQRLAERWQHRPYPTTKSRCSRRSSTVSRSRQKAARPASPTCAPPTTPSPPTNRPVLDRMRTVNLLDEQRNDTRAEDREKFGAPVIP